MEGILIELFINKRDKYEVVQTKGYNLSLKITNKQKIFSSVLTIQDILISSSEGQNISTNFDGRKFSVRILNPEESELIQLGECAFYMSGLVNITLNVMGDSNKNLLQKNHFTNQISNLGTTRWVNFIYVKSINQHKQGYYNFGSLLLNILLGLFTGFQIYYAVNLPHLETQREIQRIKNKINGVDNFNLFLACEIKRDFKKQENNLLVSYNTQVYKENFDLLHQTDPVIREAIESNILLMDASNKILDIVNDLPYRRNELAPILVNSADQIIINLSKYNEQNLNDCAEY